MKKPGTQIRKIPIGIVLAFAAIGAAGAQDGSPGTTASIPPEIYQNLKFRYIGPIGNRVSSVAGVVGNPWVYYAGAASGGIFKTTNGGTTWQSIFDKQPVSSIGSLAVAPSDPNIIWAGTGDTWIRSNISVGWGIFKS